MWCEHLVIHISIILGCIKLFQDQCAQLHPFKVCNSLSFARKPGYTAAELKVLMNLFLIDRNHVCILNP